MLKILYLPIIAIFLIGIIFVSIRSSYADSQDLEKSIPANASPLLQFKLGIPAQNIKCFDNDILIIKAEDGSPACVKPQTEQKLLERGWGIITNQTTWFEFTSIECKLPPWVQWSRLALGISTPQVLIQQYFKDQGITIIVPLWTGYINAMPPPPCGAPSVVYYFLIPESDDNKMSSLGYNETKTIPSYAHSVDQQ